MLSAENRPKLDLKYWKQINSREVSHLMAAEVIHNLYGRYWPRVNSIRFRHTITNFISGNVTTYAPKREWKYLEEWLSKKFLVYDEILRAFNLYWFTNMIDFLTGDKIDEK